MSELDPRIEADVREASEIPSDLWSRIEADLDAPGPRDSLVSLSTPTRVRLATGVLIVCGLTAIALQGVRGDLDTNGWLQFAGASAVFVVASLLAGAFALRSRATAPLPSWPWIPLSWTVITAWSTLGPWPGMTGVPAEMHAYCFKVTAAMVTVGTIAFALLERGSRPVAWRLGLGACSAGMAAFVFQSVFCPGVDALHLLLGHGGAAFLASILVAVLSLVYARIRP